MYTGILVIFGIGMLFRIYQNSDEKNPKKQVEIKNRYQDAHPISFITKAVTKKCSSPISHIQSMSQYEEYVVCDEVLIVSKRVSNFNPKIFIYEVELNKSYGKDISLLQVSCWRDGECPVEIVLENVFKKSTPAKVNDLAYEIDLIGRI